MQKARRSSVWGKASLLTIAALFFVCIAATSFAQQRPVRQPGGAGLSPEKEMAAQTIEAQFVAKTLQLSDDNTSKLAQAYIKARKSLNDARQALRSQGTAGGFQAFQELTDKESKKLEADIKKFLNDDQVKKAMESLGTFNTTWDRMVDALAGYKLEKKALDKALDKVHGYIIESAKLMQQARASGSFQEIRPKLQELRDKLDKAMESILSKDQLEQWKQVAARRARRTS
jgi:hypothetical protein